MIAEQAAIVADKTNITMRSPDALGLQGLSYEDCTSIHDASLEVLDKTGVIVTSSKAQAIFAGHGARIDKTKNRVCLPPHLIEKALATIPPKIFIPGRDPSGDYHMGGDSLGFVNFGTTVYVNDLYTGKRRKTVKKDVARATRLLDKLSSIDILITVLTCTDKSPITETLHATAAMLANTIKPVEAVPPTADLIPKMALLGEAVVGKAQFRRRPFFLPEFMW